MIVRLNLDYAFVYRDSAGLVRSCAVVGTEEMLAAQNSLDIGQMWDPGKPNEMAIHSS